MKDLRQQSQPEDRKGREFSLKELVSVLSRRRWIVLGIALPIILVSVVGTLRTVSVYTAESMVMIETRRPENPSFNYMSYNYDVVMSSAAQIAQSIPVSRLAAKALADSIPAIAALSEKLRHLESEDDLIEVLQRGVSSSPVGEATILKISFSHENPRFSLMAVEAVTNAYMEYSITSQQNPRAIDYYLGQIARIQDEIDSLMTRKADIVMDAGFATIGNDQRASAQQILSIEEEYLKARSRRAGLQVKYDEMVQALRNDPFYVPGSRTGEYVALSTLQVQHQEEVAKLANVRLQYAEDSVWVQRQLVVVEDVRKQIRQQLENYINDMRIQLAETRSAEEDLRRSIETQKSALANFPAVSQQLSSIDFRITTQSDLIEALHLKLGEIRLAAAADQSISNIIPLNEPSLMVKVGGSKKILYMVLSTILGLALGILAALFADRSDRRIFDRYQAESDLGVPVLGAISDQTKD